ncbi:MAG: tetratricopeptide repeat protein [Clostridium sp.]|uniref:tetratricopeptide repeat protein n=1 Tax=Clostridium sp. TaxID=1506 RepID=UPI003D6D60B1
MRIIFCNITWLKNYIGVNDDDKLIKTGGGAKGENNEAHESYNFQDYNGKCYGYVSNRGGSLNLERFEKATVNDDSVENVLVIWVAKQSKTGKNVIVGWYKNAILYRYSQECYLYGGIGRDLYFSMEAWSKDCFLLPESERIFEIPRSTVAEKDMGMVQSNIWYAESGYAKTMFIPKVLEFMESYKGGFINTVYSEELLQKTLSVASMEYQPLVDKGEKLVNKEEFYNALLHYNTAREINDTADALFGVGESLIGLNMFSRAIIAFENTILMEGDKNDSLYYLLCLYMNTDQFVKAVNICDRMLQVVDKSDVESTCSIYYYKVYAYNALEDDTQAIKCLDFIIKGTADEDFRKDAIGMKLELTSNK